MLVRVACRTEAFATLMSSSNMRPLTAIESPNSGGPVRDPVATLDFAALYDGWFERVVRWLRALGAPPADVEDLAQEVFLVVRRRLPAFDGRNLGGWLLRISHRQVLRHRRLYWVKRVFVGSSREPATEELPHGGASPLATLETKERQRQFERLVSRLSDKRRVVFLLFEVEGYSGTEIAELLDVPINTVWTRLHHARRDFFKLLALSKRKEASRP